MKDVFVYPAYSIQELEELKALLLDDGYLVDFYDPRNKGGVGDVPTTTEIVRQVVDIYVRIFRDFNVLDFIRDWSIQAGITAAFLKVIKWSKKDKDFEPQLNLSIQFKDDFYVSVTLEGDIDETFNGKLNEIVQKEYEIKMKKAVQGELQLFLKWSAKESRLTKEREYLIEHI